MFFLFPFPPPPLLRPSPPPLPPRSHPNPFSAFLISSFAASGDFVHQGALPASSSDTEKGVAFRDPVARRIDGQRDWAGRREGREGRIMIGQAWASRVWTDSSPEPQRVGKDRSLQKVWASAPACLYESPRHYRESVDQVGGGDTAHLHSKGSDPARHPPRQTFVSACWKDSQGERSHHHSFSTRPGVSCPTEIRRSPRVGYADLNEKLRTGPFPSEASCIISVLTHLFMDSL